MDPQPHPRLPVNLTSNREQRDANRRRREVLQNRERSLSDEAREQRRLRDRHLRQNFDSHDAWADSLQQRVGAGPVRSVQLSDPEQRQPYSENAPQRQALYDWAPANEEGDEEELDEILSELREQQPHTHPDILRVLGRAQLEARQAQLEFERSRRSMGPPGSRTGQEETNQSVHQSSLRTAAILSSVRRNRQLSARSRDLMQRYVMDRERGEQLQPSTDTRDERGDRSSSSSTWLRMAQQANEQHTNRYELNRMAWQASQRPSSSHPLVLNSHTDPSPSTSTPHPDHPRNVPHIPRSAETLETLRRRYLEDPNQREAKAVARFEQSIRTLDQLRNPDHDLQDLKKIVAQHNCRQSELYSARVNALGENAALKLRAGLRPPPCSFLRPGITFSGFQQAAPQPATVVASSSLTITPDHIIPSTSTYNPTNPTTLYRLPNGAGLTTTSIDNTAATAAARAAWAAGRDGTLRQNNGSSSSPGLRRRDVAGHTTSTPPQHDRWAVRVHLHVVDYENMTVQGTMEAFDMPSGNPSMLQYPLSSLRSTQSGLADLDDRGTTALPDRKTTTFSTYLEGELIDLHTHSLRTTNPTFPASATDDAKYWRRLRPFSLLCKSRGGKDPDTDAPSDEKEKSASHTDDTRIDDRLLAASAIHPDWLTREWQEQYILMRWKERCFMRPVDAPSEHTTDDDGLRNVSGERELRSQDGTAASTPSFGLSIKGFYYVSMRRCDGRIEGLYFDPQTSPYQRLEMGVEWSGSVARGGGVGWGFA